MFTCCEWVLTLSLLLALFSVIADDTLGAEMGESRGRSRILRKGWDANL